MHALAFAESMAPAPTPAIENTASRLSHHTGYGKGALSYWMASPEAPQPDAVPLIAVHGIKRDPRGQALGFGSVAAALGRPVIAPLFDRMHYPHYQRVIFGRRADMALLNLTNHLTRTGVIDARCFDLFGYSGGAQFAHRFALLHPQRVRQLTLASAGWYTFPDESAYPYGVSRPSSPTRAWGPHVDAGLDELLHRPIRVCVGELDNTADALTRDEPALNRQQGMTRLERAGNWLMAMRRAARERGIEADIRFHELPRCGHDFKTCLRAGLADIALHD